jgi:hypothetical protein
MVQLGQRLSQEIANIQNSLQNRDLAESEASLLVGGADVDARLLAKTQASTVTRLSDVKWRASECAFRHPACSQNSSFRNASHNLFQLIRNQQVAPSLALGVFGTTWVVS